LFCFNFTHRWTFCLNFTHKTPYSLEFTHKWAVVNKNTHKWAKKASIHPYMKLSLKTTLYLKTGFAVESGHERTFSSENLLRQPFLFSKEACKTSQKLSEKGCFWLEFLVFFLFFSSVRDSFFRIFSHKSNVTPHFWPWKKTTWPKGWRRWSNMWHMEILSTFIFFMWCDVQRFPSFLLLSRLLCCQRGHPLDWIEYMTLIVINIFSETVLRKWYRDWIDSTK
jgi:hypothetical protein